MNVELLSNFVASYMTSVEPSLPKDLLNVQDYKTTVVQRFKNPAISDQIERLLMDGSAKFNEYICGALEFLVEHEYDYSVPVKVIALMIKGYSDIVEMTIKDDRYDELVSVCKLVKADSSKVGSFVEVTMGEKFLRNAGFMKLLEETVVAVFSEELEVFLKC